MNSHDQHPVKNIQEQYSDLEIIQRVLNGEQYLFQVLIRRNNAMLYKIGRSYGLSHEDVQDLMQDSYVDAYAHLSAFENRSLFKTWIARIMLNKCFRKKQKASYRQESETEFGERSIPMFSEKMSGDPDRFVQNRELHNVIEYALLGIPEDYRMVFVLREINGFSVKETAGIADISESNVKVRLARAKQMLRTEIEKYYKPEEIFEFHLMYCDAMVKRVMDIIKE